MNFVNRGCSVHRSAILLVVTLLSFGASCDQARASVISNILTAAGITITFQMGDVIDLVKDFDLSTKASLTVVATANKIDIVITGGPVDGGTLGFFDRTSVLDGVIWLEQEPGQLQRIWSYNLRLVEMPVLSGKARVALGGHVQHRWHQKHPDEPADGPILDFGVSGMAEPGNIFTGTKIEKKDDHGPEHQDFLTARTIGVAASFFDDHSIQVYTFTVSAAHVPEPTTFAIMGVFGLGGVAIRTWKRRSVMGNGAVHAK